MANLKKSKNMMLNDELKIYELNKYNYGSSFYQVLSFILKAIIDELPFSYKN